MGTVILDILEASTFGFPLGFCAVDESP